jgi:hypothetical protein
MHQSTGVQSSERTIFSTEQEAFSPGILGARALADWQDSP